MAQKFVNILVINSGSTLANHLIGRLRTEGFIPRASLGKQYEEVSSLLESTAWDLILWFAESELDINSFTEMLSSQECAVLYIQPGSTAASTVPPLVREILTRDNEEQIILAMEWEINNHLRLRELRSLQGKMHQLEKNHLALLDSAPDPISFIDKGMHLYCNAQYSRLFGYDEPEAMFSVPFLDLVSQKDRNRVKKVIMAPHSATSLLDFEAVHKDGETIQLQVKLEASRYKTADSLKLYIKAAPGNSSYANKIAQLDHQDLLTRLYNQPYFMNCLEQAIGRAIKDDTHSTLLLVAINEYLDIETTLGKSRANMVLNDIAIFLRDSLGRSFSAARLGECEFALLLDEPGFEQALKVGDFIKGKINKGITTTALPSMQLSCSVGVVSINGYALDASDLVSKARSNINLEDMSAADTYPAPNADLDTRINHLAQAITDNKFKLLYQPIVNIRESSNQGYEVLVRMLDEHNNEIPPAQFIALANSNGLGEELDKLITTSALDTLASRQQLSQRMIINITSNSLVSKTFLPWLSETLANKRVPADCLVIQISEIDISSAMKHARSFCQQLAQLGVGKTLSHFGYALDPFEYLDLIEPEYVKLDNSLLRDVIYSSEHKNDLKVLIERLHKKGLKVVAPQIEDVDILPLMWEIGIDFVQGYCLQAPTDEMNYEFVQEQEITLDASTQ